MSAPHNIAYRRSAAWAHSAFKSDKLATLVCHSVSPNGLCRFTDSRIEVSWGHSQRSVISLIQFASTFSGQASANSLRLQLDQSQSSTEAAWPDRTGLAERSIVASVDVRRVHRKSGLLNMPAAPKMSVIAPYVTRQKPLHELAQRLMMRGFNHEVKVVRH